jgi:uncharacterized protein YwgA
MNENDHDILVSFKAEVGAKLDRVISDVKELKDNVAARVTALEEEKVNRKDFDELSDSVTQLQKLVYIGLGIVLTLEFAISIYVAFFKH